MNRVADPSTATACLTIDLGALRANWRNLANRVGAAECAAVVKADAYGLGLAPAATALWAEGARSFFVARLSEGETLRRALPEARVFVLDGLAPGTAPALQAARLSPCLGSAEEIAEWRAAGGAARDAALHFDTGMNRLGLAGSEAGEALAALGGAPGLIMTHLVSAEAPDNPDNARQTAAFEGLAKQIPESPASICNSSGIFLPQKPFHDLARPGYALYGGNPRPGADNPMAPVVRLTAPILLARIVPAGEKVGYNRLWTARRDSRVVIIAAGYADGLMRAAFGADDKAGAQVLVGDVPCPIVGRISMDLIAIDATAAPAEAARRGQSVEILGDRLGVDAFAAAAGTVGYEVLTNLGRRYRRIYTG